VAPDMTLRDSIQHLGDALQAHLQVTPAADLETLFSGRPADQQDGGTAQYLIGDEASAPGIRVQLHHDLTPAMLVHDPHLLTLGLVEVVPATSGSELSTAIDQILDRAAYLRQLCLFEAESAGQLAYVVELVLLFTREHTNADALEQTVSRLRELARETGYLRALGVSLLSEEPDGGYTPDNLRRAFPWVLTYTRKWFNSEKVRSRAAQAPCAGPWEVTLGNYRSTRRREYKFQGAGPADAAGPAVHILHGYNGSGKTTFAEALELLLTRRIERLGDPRRTDYYQIVRHRPRRLTNGTTQAPSPDPTMVKLTMTSNGTLGVSASVTIAERAPAAADPQADANEAQPESVRGEWEGLADSNPLETAASFRLDQPFMDDLIRSDEAKRAARFLRAFFPEERSIFDELTQASAVFESALNALPGPLKEALEKSVSSDKPLPPAFAVLNATLPSGRADALQTLALLSAVTEAQLDLLGRVESSMLSIISRWRNEPTSVLNVTEELTKLDSAVEHLRPRLPEMKRHLETASRFFVEFANWQSTKRVDRGQVFEQTLNEWLGLQALADLVAKYHDVVSTLAEAREAGWQMPKEYQTVFKDVGEDSTRLAFLKAQREAIALARDRARTAVHAWGSDRAQSVDSASPSPATPPPRTHISASEAQSLNEVCAWLPALGSEASVPLLGDLVVRTLDTGEPATRGQCSIGVPNGMSIAASQAEALLEAIRIIEPPEFSVAAIYDNWRKAHDALSELAGRRNKVRESFFSRLAAGDHESKLLADALHELLALFKPAPWAYHEILFRARLRSTADGSQTETLGLVSDNLPAELRLNTAEMNSFTLALFLLCAPSLANPLRLLVLDDPLQNMDEMTVNSLARALGRLVRIYPPGWRLVALFHAEEDLHRVRAEVPCAVYRLPWVNPTGATEDPIGVERDESTWTRSPQKLSTFITSLPSS